MGGLFLAGSHSWSGGRLMVAYSSDLLQALGPSAIEVLSGWLSLEFTECLVSQGMGFTWIIPSSTLASLTTAGC